jgi:hypothetical protein
MWILRPSFTDARPTDFLAHGFHSRSAFRWITGLGILCLTTTGYTQVKAESDSADVSVLVACARPGPRENSYARLRWRAASKQAVENSRIELTVYSRGFESGQYITFAESDGWKEHLEPSFAKQLGEGMPRALRVAVTNFVYDEKKGIGQVDIEGLEPNLVYQFRIAQKKGSAWEPTTAVVGRSLVCVVDPIYLRRR